MIIKIYYCLQLQNDEFCDNKNGSDEDRTSACSHLLTKFHCPDKIIPSSRVNDGKHALSPTFYLNGSFLIEIIIVYITYCTVGVCDCCDGSDETHTNNNIWAPTVPCPHTCIYTANTDHITTSNKQENNRNTDSKSIKDSIQKYTIKDKKSKNNMHMLIRDRGIAAPRKKKQSKDSNILTSITNRTNNYIVGIMVIIFILCIPGIYFICYSSQCINLWRNSMYIAKLVCLYVGQKLGLSSVQESYAISSKDATHMV